MGYILVLICSLIVVIKEGNWNDNYKKISVMFVTIVWVRIIHGSMSSPFCTSFLLPSENSFKWSASLFRTSCLPIGFSSPTTRLLFYKTAVTRSAGAYISFHRIYYFFLTPQFTPLRPKCPWMRGFSFFHEILMTSSEKKKWKK